MNEEWAKIQTDITGHHPDASSTATMLYPGIALCYRAFPGGSFCVRHNAVKDMLQINYCKSGRILWEMGGGSQICLNPGDFSLHTTELCTDSVLTFPDGVYEGLAICIDLREAAGAPPELLKEYNIFKTVLPENFCKNSSPVFLTKNAETEAIFSAFYDQPEALRLPYQKIKTIELLLYLARPDFASQKQLAEYPPELTASIQNIHDRLLHHMEQRITIEELARQYHMNPTTLKNAFKSVYGTSLAAHIKEHRMEEAAKMLKETDQSIAEIARSVGYDSQSRFTAAFKAYYNILPREYRKKQL